MTNSKNIVNEFMVGHEIISNHAQLAITSRWQTLSSPYLILRTTKGSTAEFSLLQIIEAESQFYLLITYPPNILDDIDEVPYLLLQIDGVETLQFPAADQIEKLKTKVDLNKSVEKTEFMILAENILGSFKTWAEHVAAR